MATACWVVAALVGVRVDWPGALTIAPTGGFVMGLEWAVDVQVIRSVLPSRGCVPAARSAYIGVQPKVVKLRKRLN